jgi:PAS domain S-box-containing protein
LSDWLIFRLEDTISPWMLELLRIVNDILWFGLTITALYIQIRKHQWALIRSERQYRALFEANPNPMWVFHRDTLAFLAVNDAAVAQYGYKREEFLNLSIRDIRPAEDLIDLEEIVRKNITGFNQLGHWRHTRKSGEVFPVAIVSHDIVFNNRPGILTMATDITPIVHNEEQLREAFQQEKTLREQLSIQYEELLKVNAILQEIAWINSHELRRPVASLLGLIGLLKDTSEEKERKDCLVMLEASSKELDDIVRDINQKIDFLKTKTI